MFKLFWAGMALLLVAGCTSYGVVENAPSRASVTSKSYSIQAWQQGSRSGDISLMLAFSGGGTRAAALSYGVLRELRDTGVVIEGRSKRLLDEVDYISSVSGGSFTSAYYGLYGERIFDDFEQAFLRKNVEGALIKRLFNPAFWFSSKGRTELAVQYYESTLFHGATFADMIQEDRPMILINASDLGYGARFTFVQEYFNLLCSDLSSFPVARAVAASSAVPVLFNPIVTENYPGCNTTKPDWLVAAQQRAVDDPQMNMLVHGLETYFDKEARKYAHFVDGGITDNLGLRAIYDIIELSGGPSRTLKKLKRKIPRRLVLITVNASTDPEPVMDQSNQQPSLEETINAMSDVQLHRYNAATLELMEESLTRWAKELSTAKRPVTPYFIQLSFRDIQQPEAQRFFSTVPTSFSLSDEQVDKLIDAGHQLLRENPDYRRLLADIGGHLGPVSALSPRSLSDLAVRSEGKPH